MVKRLLNQIMRWLLWKGGARAVIGVRQLMSIVSDGESYSGRVYREAFI